MKAETPVYFSYRPVCRGATFRGTFGFTLKNLVCANPSKECETCPLQGNCVYYRIFETPFELGEAMAGFSAEKAPQPFLIEPMLAHKRDIKRGEEFTINLIIIGDAIQYFPYFIFAFDEMGKKYGVGKWKKSGLGEYKLQRISIMSNQQETEI